MISKSLEEYLKNMYILKMQTGNIRVTDIAKKMNCTKPSVNKALNNLRQFNFITYETYGPIELTKEGENLAKKILETYDIVYLFLKDVLGLESQKAIEEADKIKFVMSDETINLLAKYVHKVLNLESLDCCYDINKEKCWECEKRTLSKNKKESLKRPKLKIKFDKKIYKKEK